MERSSETAKPKGSRLIGGMIIFLIILFFSIEFFIQEAQEFSPNTITDILLLTLQIIVLLLFLILLFVLGRNLAKLFLERKRKVAGSHFKTRLLVFFIALAMIPTMLLLLFASDLISQNIEQWFRTPIDKILADTNRLAEGFYQTNREITLHYAHQLSRKIEERKLYNPANQDPLRDFVRDKLKEYLVDEIAIFLDDAELFAFMNPDLPYRYYQDLSQNMIQRAHLGEEISTITEMGTGQMIRRGVSIQIPERGSLLVVAGKYLPQNFAQKIETINAYVNRYRQGKIQKNDLKTFYLMTLIFVTLLIVFAASWIGFHLARSITVPIEKLARATKEVSRGDLSVRVEDPASDEIGEFIDSFNQMLSDLQESRRNIAHQTTELEGRKQYIETILDTITTGLISLDRKSRITTINPSAREMLGLDHADLLGKSIRDVLGHPRYAEVNQLIAHGMHDSTHLQEKEIKINLDAQTVTLAITISPLRRSGKTDTGLIIVFDNLTQLIHAQKIAAWQEVAQRVAHEIKNPLTPIQLSAERIIRRMRRNNANSDDTIEEGAQTIVQEAGAIKALVDEFSNFARMPKIQIKTADLHEIIMLSVNPFKGIFTDIQFDTQFSEAVPSPIRLDSEHMRRVFINLIDNAIDAMNKKGVITIRTGYLADQERVRIEVGDTGPGIRDEDKDKLFLPHFSTKKKGSGLGLAIVRQIISEHNGTIQVEDNKPLGAKFIIQVPK